MGTMTMGGEEREEGTMHQEGEGHSVLRGEGDTMCGDNNDRWGGEGNDDAHPPPLLIFKYIYLMYFSLLNIYTLCILI